VYSNAKKLYGSYRTEIRSWKLGCVVESLNGFRRSWKTSLNRFLRLYKTSLNRLRRSWKARLKCKLRKVRTQRALKLSLRRIMRRQSQTLASRAKSPS
jgi:hypothetical protein